MQDGHATSSCCERVPLHTVLTYLLTMVGTVGTQHIVGPVGARTGLTAVASVVRTLGTYLGMRRRRLRGRRDRPCFSVFLVLEVFCQ